MDIGGGDSPGTDRLDYYYLMVNKISAGNVTNTRIMVNDYAQKDDEGRYVCTYMISSITEDMESGFYMLQGNNRNIPCIVSNCGNGDIIMVALPQDDNSLGFAVSTEIDLENHTVTFCGGYLNVDNEY